MPGERIIRAGGGSTGLWPAMVSIAKQLFPLDDEPLIYWALAIPIMAGTRDILVIFHN